MLNKPPEVGDLLTEHDPSRWSSIWRVVEVNLTDVKLNLYSEVTPVQGLRKFYKKSIKFKNVEHSKLNTNYDFGVDEAYKKHMLAAQNEWREALPSLKEYVI